MVHRALTLAFLAVVTAACDTRLSGGFRGVTPPATRLAFVSQPSNVQAGVAMTPAVQVAVQNDVNQTITTSTASIIVTIVPGTGTAGATLTGGAAQTATNGIVTFANLRVDLAGTGYQLLASASGFPSVASTPFNVSAP